MRTQTVSQSVIPQSSALYIAFELGAKSWKLALSDGFTAKPRLVSLEAGDLDGVERHIAHARSRFSLTDCCPVLTCYEAGRDGFWIHRALERRGIHNVIVDPASIEVNRRFRRAKTDRLDATKLVSMLMRYHRGESRVWSVVRVPGVEDEDFRQLSREYQSLGKEVRQHRMRIQSLLATQGIAIAVKLSLRGELDTMRNCEGEQLGARLKARIVRRQHRTLTDTVQQRRHAAGARHRQIWEPVAAKFNGGACVGVVEVSAAKRVECMVLSPLPRRQSAATQRHRSARSEVAHRFVAIC